MQLIQLSALVLDWRAKKPMRKVTITGIVFIMVHRNITLIHLFLVIKVRIVQWQTRRHGGTQTRVHPSDIIRSHWQRALLHI